MNKVDHFHHQLFHWDPIVRQVKLHLQHYIIETIITGAAKLLTLMSQLPPL